MALRTQQLIGFEAGVADVIDPLAGSYYIEALTDRVEEEAKRLPAGASRTSVGRCMASRRASSSGEIQESAFRLQAHAGARGADRRRGEPLPDRRA